MSASAGCAARPSNGASQIRRLTSCVFHVILFAACLQAVGGDATLGQSTDLRVWQYVDRGVVLAWTQTYPDAATGRNVSEYRVWDGPALLESVTPDAAGVVTSCENASEPCTFPPCNDECYTAELRVVVPNLYPGTMHNLSVDAVFSLEGGITPVAGARSETVDALIYGAPTAPLNFSGAVGGGGVISLVWNEPENTGLGGSWATWGFESSEGVLQGYQVMVSTSSAARAALSCAGITLGEYCVLSTLLGSQGNFDTLAVPASRRYYVASRAYNLFLEGAVEERDFWVEGKPDAPRELKVNIEDHFVFRLDWDPPVSSGREPGETFDRYELSFREASGNFEPCSRDGGPLQCLSTKHILMPSGCRTCGVQTCLQGEVCFSSEALSASGTRFMLLGCLEQSLSPYFNNGSCTGPYAAYENCRTCNSSECNNAAPSERQDGFCALRVDEPYCAGFVGEEVMVELGAPGQALQTALASNEPCDEMAAAAIVNDSFPPSTTSYTLGGNPLATPDRPFALKEGSLYYFRLAACHASGCGAWSNIASARAIRLQMAAAIRPLDAVVSSSAGVMVNFTTVKNMATERWSVVVEFPAPYSFGDVMLQELGSLCNCTGENPACNATCSAVSRDGARITIQVERALPLGESVWFVLGGVVNPGVTGVTPSCSVVTYSEDGVAVDENLAVPGTLLTPGRLVVALLLDPTGAGEVAELYVSATAEAPVVENASITVVFPSGWSAFDVSGVEVGVGEAELELVDVGPASVTLRTRAPLANFSFSLVGIANPLFVGPDAAARFTVMTHLGEYAHGDTSASSMEGQLSNRFQGAPPFNTTIGVLRGVSVSTSTTWPVGALVDVSFRYVMEDAITRSGGASELVLVFPPGVGIVEPDPVCNDTAVNIDNATGMDSMNMDDNMTGADDNMTNATDVMNATEPETCVNLSTVVISRSNSAATADSAVFEVDTTSDDRQRVTLRFPPDAPPDDGGEVAWDILVRGVELPVYSPIKAAGVDAVSRAHSQHGLAAQNASTVPFAYEAGVVTTGVVTLASRVAGAVTALTLAFTSTNPTPRDGFLRLTLPPHAALLCNVSAPNCTANLSVLYNGALLTDAEAGLSLITHAAEVFVALNLTDPLPLGTRFEIEFHSIVNQPWAGAAAFEVAVLTAGRDVIEAGPAAATVLPAPLLATVVELSDLAADRQGQWQPLRPVAPATTEVHLGMSFAVPVGLPRASRISVEIPDAQVLSLRGDPNHPHVLDGESEFAARVVAGGILLVQSDGGCHALRCVPAHSTIRFNFIANVSVAAGRVLGRSREYRITIHQLQVGASTVASATVHASDALVPGGAPPPPPPGGRRLLMDPPPPINDVEEHVEMTSVTLVEHDSGESGLVTLSFRLKASFPPDGAVVINLPPDAIPSSGASVTAQGLQGGFTVTAGASSVVLTRNAGAAPMVYGTTAVKCFTEGGTVPRHSACHFPFVYQGATLFECTEVDNGGVKWCATGHLFVGYWGNCFCNSTENFLDISVQIATIKNPPFAGPASFGLVVTASDDTTDTIIAQDRDIPAVITAHRFSDFYIQLDPPKSGAVAHARVEVTLSNPLLIDGVLQLELPDIFGYSSAPIASLSGVSLPWDIAVTSENNATLLTLTMVGATQDVAAPAIVAVDIDGIVIRRWSGDISATVRTIMGPGGRRAVSEEASTLLTVFPNDLADVSVELSSSVAGKAGVSATIRFRPFNPVPPSGGIHITLPAGFEIEPPHDVARPGAPAPLTSWRLCGVLGPADIHIDYVQIDPEASTVLLLLSPSQALAAGNIVEFSIPGLTNVHRAGTSAPFALRTVLADLSVIDHSLKGTEQTLLPDMLGAARVSVLSPEAGTLSTAEVSFTTSNVLPGDGYIFVSFPPGFSLLSPVSDGYVAGIPGMLAVVDANETQSNGYCEPGCNVTLAVRGGATPRHTKVSFGIANVENMHSSGQTGAFLVQTRTAAHEVIDMAVIEGSETSAAKLGFASVSLDHAAKSGSNMSLSVAFTTSNPLGSGGRIIIKFSPLFNLSDTCYSLSSSCGDISAFGAQLSGAVSISGNSLELITSANLAEEADVRFTIRGVKAPAIAGRTGTFQIRTVSSDGREIDVDLDVEALTTLPGDMDVTASLSSRVAGATSTLLITGIVQETLPPGAWFEVDFPPGALLPDSSATQEVLNGATVSYSLGGSVAVVTPVHGSAMLDAGAVISMSFARLRNPQVAGDYEYKVRSMVSVPSVLTTGISTDVLMVKSVIDEAVITLRITPGPLASMEVLSAETAGGNVGFRGAMRVRFRVSNPVPADGAVEITFPSGVFDVSSVVSATFKAARSHAAHVVYADGSTCVDVEDNNVTISRTSGVPVGTGVLMEVEVSTVQVVGFVGTAGTVVIRTTTKDGVSINLDSTPFTVSLHGVLAQLTIDADVFLAGTRVPALDMTFYTANAIPPSGVIVLLLPAGAAIDPSSLSCSLGISGELPSPVSTTQGLVAGELQVVLAVVDRIKGGAAIALSCDGTFLRGSSGLSVYTVRTLSQDGQIIDAGEAVLQVTAGPLTEVDAIFETLMIREANALNFTLSTTNAVPVGSRFEVVVPTDFSIANTLTVASVINGVTRLLAPSVSGLQILVRLQDAISEGAHFSILVSGVSNRGYTGYVNFQVRTLHRIAEAWEVGSTDLGGQVIDEGTVDMKVVALIVDNTTVTTDAGVAGSFGEVCFNSVLAAEIPGGGAIVLVFPDGYDTSLVSTDNFVVGGLDGFSAVSKSGLSVEMVRREGTIFGPGTEVIACIQNVGMPSYETSQGYFVFETRTGSQGDPTSVIIERTEIPAVPLKQAALSVVGAPYLGSDRQALPAGPGAVTVAPHTNQAGTLPLFAVSFWTVNSVPSGGSIRIKLPPGFAINATAGVTCEASSAFVPSFTAVPEQAGGKWHIRLVLSEAMKASVSVAIECAGVRVARTAGSYSYFVQTEIPAGNVIDSGAASGVVVASSVQPASVVLASAIAHAATDIVVSLTPANPLVSGDSVEIDFPPGVYFCEEAVNLVAPLDCSSANFSALVTCDARYAGCMCHSAACVCKKAYAACKSANNESAGPCVNVVTVTHNDQVAHMCITKVIRAFGHELPTHPQPATTITLAVDAPYPPGASLAITIPGARNRGWVGPSGKFTIRTRAAEGALVDGCDPLDAVSSSRAACDSEEVKSVDILAAELPMSEIELELYTAGNEGRAILSFVTNTTFLNDSFIDLTLPPGFLFDPYAPLSGLHSGLDGALLATVASNRVLITRVSGTSIPPGVTVRVEFAMVSNLKHSSCTSDASCEGSSGSFVLRIANRDDTTQDLDTRPLLPLIPAPLNSSSITPTYPVAGATGTLTVAFRTVNPLPADGRISLTLPEGFALAELLQALPVEGMTGLLVASPVSPREVLIERLRGAVVGSGELVSFTLSSVRNRVSSGDSGTYQVRTRLADNTLIDVDLDISGHPLLPGELQHASALPASLTAGARSPLRVSLVVANPLPADGGINILLPEGFQIPLFTVLLDGYRSGGTPIQYASTPLAPSAAALSGLDGALSVEIISPREVTIRRVGANKTVLPCASSRPEVELNRDVISPGFVLEDSAGAEGFYAGCTVELLFDTVENKHVSGGSNVYRLRTLMADGTIIDEATLDAHEVTHGALLRTDVEPASLESAAVAATLVTMLATNGIPSDGRIRVTFPSGFDIGHVNVGAAASDTFRAEGGVLLAASNPIFTVANCASTSAVPLDLARITLSFALNMDLLLPAELGAMILIANLEASNSTSSSSLALGGPDAALFSSAEFSKATGTVSLHAAASIAAGTVVGVWFELLNPPEGAGVAPTIALQTPPCGFSCTASPVIANPMSGLVLSATAAPALSVLSIASLNAVLGELTTTTVTLRTNVALQTGGSVTLSGLLGSASASSSNLAVSGPAASSFNSRGQFNAAAGVLTLSVWEHILADTELVFSFVLRNPPTHNPAQNASIELSSSDLERIRIGPINMTSTALLLARDGLAMSVASVATNSLAAGAYSTLTIRLRPTAVLSRGDVVTITGLQGSQTPDGAIAISGADAAVFERTAIWFRASGTLQLTVTSGLGLLDDRVSEVSVVLQNRASLFAGATATVSTSSGVPVTPMDGTALAVTAEPLFAELSISYSSVESFRPNVVTVSLQANANLPASAKITIAQLPMDITETADCATNTIQGAACSFPFTYAGMTFNACAGATVALRMAGASSALSQGLPWCATSPSFSASIADVNGNVDSLWGYCECAPVSRTISGAEASVFGGVGMYDQVRSTLVLTVAPGQNLAALEAAVIQFVIRNPAAMDQSGLPDYMWARVKAKAVDPYASTVCATAVLAAVSSTSFQSRIAASLGAAIESQEVLVISTTALGGDGGLVDVEYCMVDAATVGLSNSYGYLPQVSASYLSFSIPLTRVQSADLIIRPQCADPLAASSDIAFDVISSNARIGSMPTWAVATIAFGSVDRGVLTSITLSIQPNWELEAPTTVSACCFLGYSSPFNSEVVAVLNEGGIIFGNVGEFQASTGRVTITIVAGQVLPCSRVSNVTFTLRNPDAVLSNVPVNLTAFGGPLRDFSAPTGGPVHVVSATASIDSGFWVTKRITDTSRAFNGLNLVTVLLRPALELFAGTNITIAGLTGSQTPSASAFLLRSGAGIFDAEWINERDGCSEGATLDCSDSDARMVLTVREAASFLPAGVDTSVAFLLVNKAYHHAAVRATISVSIANESLPLLDRTIPAEPMLGTVLEASMIPGFSALSVSSSSDVLGALATVTLAMTPNTFLAPGSLINVTGLGDSCPDRPALAPPPPFCSNIQNPSSPTLPLSGADAAAFSSSGAWDAARGVLTLTAATEIVAGTVLDVQFRLRNKGSAFGGVAVLVRLDGLTSQLEDGVRVRTEGGVVTVERDGSGRALMPGETLSFSLLGVRLPGHSGPTGTYQIATFSAAGMLIDQDLAVPSDLVLPSTLQARVDLSHQVAGYRGDVTVSLSTSNPVPPGGTIAVFFPKGFQLDTGNWDVFLWNEPYTVGGSAGLTVTSDYADLSVRIATEGSVIRDTGLDRDIAWHTTAIVTNRGSAPLPAVTRYNFTLHGVQYPIASHLSGTYQIRTFSPDGKSIDEDLSVAGPTDFGAGTLGHTSVFPSSLSAGAISPLTVSFVNMNPIPIDGRIEVTLPAGFYLSSDQGQESLAGIDLTRAGDAAYGIDFSGEVSPDVLVPVGATRARSLYAEPLEGMDGNLTLVVHDARRFTVWRRGANTVQRQSRVRFRLVDPTAEFEVTAPTIGVQNPEVAGLTGVYSIQVKLHDGTIVDQDLAVPGDVITPGALSQVDIHPVSLYAGATGALYVSLAVANPLPVNGSIRITLPLDLSIEDAAGMTVGATPLLGLDGGLTAEVVDNQTLVVSRVNAALRVQRCQRPMCGTTNIVLGGTSSSSPGWRPPSFPANAFTEGVQWRSGPITPGAPQWAQYDFGTPVSVCSYSLQSRASDVLGYLSSDGPTAYRLAGSHDGEAYTVVHSVEDGPVWTSTGEARAHELHVNAHFRFFRLEVRAVPGRSSGNMYTVLRNIKLYSPTGEDPHTEAKETQCKIAFTIDAAVVNRHYSGLTGSYAVSTAGASGMLIDSESAAPASVLLEGRLQAASVVPASLLAGALTSMRVSFTTSGPLPEFGEIEVVFPPEAGLNLSVASLPRATSRGVDPSGMTLPITVVDNSLDGGLGVHLLGQRIRIVRNGSGSPLPPGSTVTLDLNNIRNQRLAGPGGTYQIRTLIYDSNGIDAEYQVAPTMFAVPRLQNVSLLLASDAAGAAGAVTLAFTTQNPIPRDGRIRLRIPSEFAPLAPLHARFLSGADGYLVTTIDDDGVITMSRDGEADAPGLTEMRIEIGTVVNVPRSGDTGSIEVCTVLDDGREIDCAAPECEGCEGEAVHVDPAVLVAAPLRDAVVAPGAPYTGYDGLAVSFSATNALVSGSIIQVVIPGAFRPGDVLVESFALDERACDARVHPANESHIAFPLGDFASPDVDMDVTVSSEENGTHVINVTLTSAENGVVMQRGAKVHMSLGNVRAPGFVGPSGSFEIRTLTPEGVVVDVDADVPSVEIKQGSLMDASVAVSSVIAGDVISLVILLTSADDVIARDGSVSITLPPSFSAAHIAEYYMLDGAAYTLSDSFSPLDISGGLQEGGATPESGLEQGNYTIKMNLNHSRSGTMRFELHNLRLSNFSGPTGPFQIRTFTPSGVLIDQDLTVPGQTLRTAALTHAEVRALDGHAGTSSRLVVEFVPHNPLPLDCKIALALPPGFRVRTNSSVAVALGNAGANASYTRAEYDMDAALDGRLEITVHSERLVTLSRVGALTAANPGVRVALFVDQVRNPQRSGLTGTFQVRTLRADGTAIDEDLTIPGITISPGNFTGACPPACLPPTIKPANLEAGRVTDVSVAFFASNPIPIDALIEVVFPAMTRVDGVSGVTVASLLDALAPSGARPGPVLDGLLDLFVSHQTVRVRRAGSGRRIEAGELVSFTIHGVKNQGVEGPSGTSSLTVEQADRVVIDTSVVLGHRVVPVQFSHVEIAKAPHTAGKVATMTLSVTAGGDIVTGSWIAVDFAGEDALPGVFYALQVDGPVSEAAWALDGISGTVLFIKLVGATIPAETPIEITVLNVHNPLKVMTVEYVVSMLEPGASPQGSGRSARSLTTVDYTVGELANVVMAPASVSAGAVGPVTVAFITSSPIPNDGVMDIDIPPTFRLSAAVTASVVSGLTGTLTATRLSDTRVRLQRTLTGSLLPRYSTVRIELRDVRNQEFSGETGQLQVDTRLASLELMDTGLAPSLYIATSAMSGAVSLTLSSVAAGALSSATVEFVASSPIPSDGSLLVHFPAGFTLPTPFPAYLPFLDGPARVEALSGTTGSAGSSGTATPGAPYYDIGSPIQGRLSPPLPVDASVFRGVSVLLRRLGGSEIPVGAAVNVVIPGIKARAWSGFSGTFQVATLLGDDTLVEQDLGINGFQLLPGLLQDVSVEVSSIVSGEPVDVMVNMTLANTLPAVGELHVTFPAGYRDLEYVHVAAPAGLVGAISVIGLGYELGGATVLRLRHTSAVPTPADTHVSLVLSGVKNRFFSSRAELFSVTTLLADGTTLVDERRNLAVPSAPGGEGPGFGVVVDGSQVMVFDAADPREVVGVLDLGDLGTVTHGVSALDASGDTIYFIAGGALAAVSLSSPAVAHVPLRAPDALMGGFVSMEWDPARTRLVGLALLDGEMAVAALDVTLGNVSKLADLPACGTCECSPAQGVSALDAEAGVYYLASQVTLLGVSAGDGSLVSYTTVVHGNRPFNGFASLEFHAPGGGAGASLGLLGVALLGEDVELVKVDPVTGTLESIAYIFDADFSGQVFGGISALTPSGSHYMVLSHARLLAVDLATRVVSHYNPYASEVSEVSNSGGQWGFLEMSSFLPPDFSALPDSSSVVNASASAPPLDVSALDIRILHLEDSLPVRPGGAGSYFAVQVTGLDVFANDSLKVAPAGGCLATLPGGEATLLGADGAATVSFALALTTSHAPGAAQLCYRRAADASGAWREVMWGEARERLTFPLTMAAFQVAPLPVPVGLPVQLRLTGNIKTGDRFLIVLDDNSVNPLDLCVAASASAAAATDGTSDSSSILYPGTRVMAVVSVGALQLHAHAYGAWTEVTSDVLLAPGGGAPLRMCYSASGGPFTLMLGTGLDAAGGVVLEGSQMPVAGEGEPSSVTPQCAHAAVAA